MPRKNARLGTLMRIGSQCVISMSLERMPNQQAISVIELRKPELLLRVFGC